MPGALASFKPAWERVAAAWQTGLAERLAAAASRPGAPLSPQQLGRPERHAAQALLELRRTFESGGLSKRHLGTAGDSAPAEWRWQDLTDVQMIRGYSGVRFVVRDTDVDNDAAIYVYRPYIVSRPSPQQVAISLMQVVGAFVLSSGQDYDAWLADLPHLWVD